MEIRGFAARAEELHDLALVLGKVEAPSLRLRSSDDSPHEGRLHVLDKQLGKKSLHNKIKNGCKICHITLNKKKGKTSLVIV